MSTSLVSRMNSVPTTGIMTPGTAGVVHVADAGDDDGRQQTAEPAVAGQTTKNGVPITGAAAIIRLAVVSRSTGASSASQ
ncbi:MAG: hypothetical protein LBF16_15220 [Pseudomonadales bacterium]|nr:hypothetical protein [Pseudomonadales bacterium]